MTAVVGTNFQIFNTGYGIGVTSPMIVQLMGNLIDDQSTSWFASSLVIGQVFGSFLGSHLANTLGRKRTIILSAVFSIISWSLLASSQFYWMLILGRVLTGFFDCLSLAGGAMFVAEVSETKYKGSFINSTCIFSGMGIAFGYLFGSNLHWRFSCFVSVTASFLSVASLILCHESPVFLMMKNQTARDCLHWYRQLIYETKESEQDLQRELKQIESEVSMTGGGLVESIRKLMDSSNRRAFFIVGVLFMFFPLTGIYNISFFAVDLFNKLELGGAEVVAVMTALVRCLGTCCSSLLLLRYDSVSSFKYLFEQGTDHK